VILRCVEKSGEVVGEKESGVREALGLFLNFSGELFKLGPVLNRGIVAVAPPLLSEQSQYHAQLTQHAQKEAEVPFAEEAGRLAIVDAVSY
jgi:hypothetical protein